jgi:hypothetical protein
VKDSPKNVSGRPTLYGRMSSFPANTQFVLHVKEKQESSVVQTIIFAPNFMFFTYVGHKEIQFLVKRFSAHICCEDV